VALFGGVEAAGVEFYCEGSGFGEAVVLPVDGAASVSGEATHGQPGVAREAAFDPAVAA
jgi:hypothetical protein